MPLKDPEERKRYRREFYIKNKEKILEQCRKYRQNNKEKIRKQKEKYRKKNRERINKYERDRRRNNLEYRLSLCWKDGYPKIPIKTRRELIKRANKMCESDKFSCKGSLLIHHIDENPQNNELSNLQLLCMRHHSQLHNKLEKHPQWKGDKASKESKRVREWRRKERERLEATLCHEYN